MFTGIITDVADVRSSQSDANGMTLTIARPSNWTDLRLGESIATNGVCLTVSAMKPDEYTVYLIAETLSLTTFGKQVPQQVNLERSLQAADRFGGHFVQGHTDGIGTITNIDESDGYRVTIQFNPKFRELVIPKGSITINGLALTITDVTADTLTVALIPHTLEQTTIGTLKPADAVNLEFDVLGKYVLNSIKVREA